MSAPTARKVALCDTTADRRRGGTIHLLLSPRSVGATSGFMGVGVLEPGEYVVEHYHPYSEEFVYVVRGQLYVRLAGAEEVTLDPDDSLLIPTGVRHRFENRAGVQARVVFHNSPLAPRPDLGHVDTEEQLLSGPPPQVGGPVSASGGAT